MAGKLKTIGSQLFSRRCVACGYDGELLHNANAAQCVNCGCDFRARPPRSYAEMEGLVGDPRAMFDPPPAEPLPSRIFQRWIALCVLFTIALVTIVFLSAALLAV